ncbi:hypothetical protein niasHS_015943 [Heterodera schachtii]|uniref:C2H2-type domain-containing protein n=1 Tax=Heterodera schachtii TaxID=97005 RepID=A0ABD2HPR1_HETSC
MDSDENSPIVINLDSYCRTPLTKLLEDGKASEFLVCKICERSFQKKCWRSISGHYQWHFGGYDIDKLKSDYKNQITCAALKGNPFRFFESEEFHQIVTAYALRMRNLLRPFIIHFGEWSGSEKTRKTVTEFIHNLLIKKGAAACETVTQIGRTTDEGQNMLSGGEERFLHVRCLCHVLATIARRTTDPYHGSRLSVAEKRQLNQFSDQLKELSKFVTTAKNIPQIDDFAGSFLLESVCTRWLTNHMMCRAFHEGIDKIKEAVAQHGDDSLKADLAALSVFKEDFEAYTGIFEAFSLAVAKLEVAKSPTINLVLPVLAKLELHIQRCSDDQGEEHSLQRALARSALSCLARKIERSLNRKIVCAAAYLGPNILRKMESISKKVPRCVRVMFGIWLLNSSCGTEDVQVVDRRQKLFLKMMSLRNLPHPHPCRASRMKCDFTRLCHVLKSSICWNFGVNKSLCQI